MDALEEWSSGGDADRRDGLTAHPDLNALGRRLRMEMDETLRAEQHAARVAAQRRSTLRDRFLLAEDRAERLHVAVTDGSDIAGEVVAVGADHIVLVHAGRRCWLAMHHVVAIRSPQ